MGIVSATPAQGTSHPEGFTRRPCLRPAAGRPAAAGLRALSGRRFSESGRRFSTCGARGAPPHSGLAIRKPNRVSDGDRVRDPRSGLAIRKPNRVSDGDRVRDPRSGLPMPIAGRSRRRSCCRAVAAVPASAPAYGRRAEPGSQHAALRSLDADFASPSMAALVSNAGSRARAAPRSPAIAHSGSPIA